MNAKVEANLGGSLGLKQFVAAAHSLGLRVIVDNVVNGQECLALETVFVVFIQGLLWYAWGLACDIYDKTVKRSGTAMECEAARGAWHYI